MKLFLEREGPLSPYLLIFLFIFYTSMRKASASTWAITRAQQHEVGCHCFHAVLFLTGEPAGLPPALWETRMLD